MMKTPETLRQLSARVNTAIIDLIEAPVHSRVSHYTDNTPWHIIDGDIYRTLLRFEESCTDGPVHSYLRAYEDF